VGVFNAIDTEELSRAEISDHDWKEVTWLLRHDHEDIYENVLLLLKAKIEAREMAEAAELELEENEEDDDVVQSKPVEKEDIDDDEDSAI